MSHKYKYTRRAIHTAIKQLDFVLQDLRACQFYLTNLSNTSNPICSVKFKTIECSSPNQRIYQYVSNLFSALDYPIMMTKYFDSHHNYLLRKFKKLRVEYLPIGLMYYGDKTYSKALEGITAHTKFTKALKKRISLYEPEQISLRGNDLKEFLKRSEKYGDRILLWKFVTHYYNLFHSESDGWRF